MKKNNATTQLIMETGQSLIQERGYNAISYADIADKVGIKKASIHYYFPAKSDLVLAILQKYRIDFMNELIRIAKLHVSSEEKMFHFFQQYREPLANESKLCLCSMMAAELVSFPQEIRDELNQFFRDNEKWLERVIEEGINSGVFNEKMQPKQQSQIMMAVVQGAQLLARSSNDLNYYDMMTKDLVKHLQP